MNKRNAVGTGVLLALLGGLGYRLYSRGMGTLGASPSQVTTPFRTEEQWIASEIGADLAQMARFAKDGQSAPVSSEAAPTPPADAPWSVAGHRAHAQALLRAQGIVPRPGPASSGDTLLVALAQATAKTLAAQNQRVSQQLRADFANPDGHEDAALLIGTFALREADSHFADHRPALNRMTAHLAMAAALRDGGEPGLSGRYAHVVHALLTGRTADALERVSAMPEANSPAEAAWRAALALRATQDWRAFGSPEGRTHLERLEYLRALVATRNAPEVLTFLSGADAAAFADWSRVVAPAQLGVELGNLTVLPGLPALVGEIGEVRAASFLPEVAGEALVSDLRRAPGGCIGPSGPQALDWGAWAGFYSRAIVEHVARADMHLRRVQGAPDRADAYQRRMNATWGKLPLYAVATTHWTRRQEMNLDRIAEAIGVAIASPQLVTAHNWGRLQEAQGYEPVRRGMPAATGWFAPAIPRGTAYDASHRIERLSHSPHDRAGLEALATLDPHDFTIASQLVRARHGARPTVDQVSSGLGSRAAFDVRAARLVADAASGGESGQEEQVLAASCQRSAAACFDLAHYLVDLGRDEEAAATFERAIADSSVDRVLAAAHSRWLIDYHFARGDRGRALTLADAAAATGSYPGLSFRANLMERLERFDEAEEGYEQMAEGYDSTASLVAFHFRMARQRGRAEYESKLKRSARTLFPRGLEKAEGFGSAPPTDGARVMTDSPQLRAAGLRAGDVIVGLDGWRIREAAQYEAVVRFDRREPMVFTVWRGGYQEVRASVKDRWLGVTLVDHPVKGWIAGKREIEG